MRPRFMNRGSQTGSQSLANPCDASMRPRFMNRGSPDLLYNQGVWIACFNEAPIHESGKYD